MKNSGIMEKDIVPFQKVVFYDSLDSMLMGLTSGEVTALSVPDCTVIQTYITDAAESGETVAVEFEQFEGEPIKVAVTGSLPPMDYVAADGTPAGFNTAVLAEIGKRLEKNIELVQVDSVSRALALAQGNVDVVFWTRARSEGVFENRDNPEGTVNTVPCYTDLNVIVTLK